jgi:hypothetical protein
MPGCATPGGCGRTGPGWGMEFVDGRWRCHLCEVIAKLPQPTTRLDLQKGDRPDLKPAKVRKDLSGPRAAAADLAFVKRHREGAFRKQRR